MAHRSTSERAKIDRFQVSALPLEESSPRGGSCCVRDEEIGRRVRVGAMLMAAALATMAHPSLPFIRGANVGAYFVPERWMAPSFYSGTDASSLCELVRHNRSLAEERMRQHLESFVVEEDFKWLAEQGFNAVRVPVGYWNALGAVSGIPYVPASPSVSLAYLDRVFEWGRKHGLAVLLDLHGAPGSQNGADHSGCDSDGVGWHGDASVKLSLKAIDTFARRYAPHPSFLGIELMNEPGWAVEWDHGKLLEYYTRAYALVHAASPSALVVFNVLFWSEFPAGFGNWWDGQLLLPNVVLDLHLYDCFGEASGRTLSEHKDQARAWSRAIERFKAMGHAVMVGEWSLATGVSAGGQEWADAQIEAFSGGVGWFFWSLKKEDPDGWGDEGGNTWSLRGAVKSGITGLGASDKSATNLIASLQAIKDAGSASGSAAKLMPAVVVPSSPTPTWHPLALPATALLCLALLTVAMLFRLRRAYVPRALSPTHELAPEIEYVHLERDPLQ